uniref:Protein translocase subunit SecY n=1 Tax=Membranoptera platyphylla TaxID=1204437 RepID=A0A1I9KQL7_9FLOR|nr:protein translocase subunit SecY [Membranoptera platyphylla]AMJ16915.1 protein translocase subunit SecY [Membranoptera platyphylla]
MENKKKLLNKIIITLSILLICRMGIFIPIPGINHDAFNDKIQNNSLLNFLNIFSGGGFSTIGIFALGIIPYINSSIITQLLIKIIPYLENLQKEEGEIGRKKITQITRYFTLLWAFIQSCSIALWIKPYTFNWNNYFILDCIITLTTGSMIIMWFSEIITEYGLGNGSSLIIFQNIISNIPQNLLKYNVDINQASNFNILIIVLIIGIIILMISILTQESKRKINIISSKQLGKTNILNTQSYIPLKINQGGVMPIIFASAAMTLPTYIISILNENYSNLITKYLLNNNICYLILYSVLIILFSYFYSSIILNTKEIATNLKKMGASIPNIRPGSETVKYLEKIVNKLTFIGAFFLFTIAQLPYITFNITKIKSFQGLGTTSLLILVGVAIDTAKQIQTYIISEQYDNMIE